MFVVLALAVLAAAEPEADPQLLVGGIHGVHTPYTHVAPVSTYSSPLLRTLVPAVKSIIPTIKTMVPAVQTVATTPLVSTYNTAYGVGYPLTYGAHPYGVITKPKAIITNYQDSEHYTAEATTLGKALGEPSYVAKNGEVVHKVEKREAEADAALLYSGLHTPSVYSTGINSVYNRAVVSPYTYGSSLYRNVLPALTKNVIPPVSYRSPCIGCHPALSHIIHKREAEADAAHFYSGLRTPSVYSTGINSVYNRAVVSPYTYGSSLYRNVLPAVSTPLMSSYQAAIPAVSSYRSPCIGCHPTLSHMIHKREAEADPALVYSGLTHTPFTGINSVYNTAGVINPLTYSGLTHTPFAGINSVYNTAAINPVVYNAGVIKSYDHGVAVTPFGAVHSSHVGKCLNNEGVEVSC